MQTRKNRTQGRRSSIQKLARAIARGPAGLEHLEDRRLLTTFHVTETQDFLAPFDPAHPSAPPAPAEGTLRWAIDKANRTPGRDDIRFDFSGPEQVTLSIDADMDAQFGPLTVTEGLDIVGVRNGNSPLVWLDGGVEIEDGLVFQAGASTVSGLGFSNFIGAAVRVTSAGNTIGGAAPGAGNFFINNYGFDVLVETTANDTTITSNLMAVSFGTNVAVVGLGQDNQKHALTGVVISDNTFGLRADGHELGNFGHAVKVENTAPGSDVRITRNLIAGGNADGIRITSASGVTIAGNRIGVDMNGDAAGGTANAITIEEGSSDILVGGFRGGDGNLLANQEGNGLRIADSSAVQVFGNTIRANLDDGIALVNASDNQIVLNTIVDGGSNGVGVYTDPVANPAKGNTIRGNSIANNNGLGIELMTLRKSGEIMLPDPGPTPAGNAKYAYTAAPTLAYAKTHGLTVVVKGTLQGVAGKTYVIDVYANSHPDAIPADDPAYNGHSYGEGEFYLGQVTATADELGLVTFAAAFEGLDPANFTAVSATATAPDGSTSEFSENAVPAAVSAPFATNTVLTSSASLTRPGQEVTFTARVSGPDGAVIHSGLVEFLDGATSLGYGLVENGVATLTVSTLALGNHTITATYSPASTDFTGSSATLSHAVKATSTTTLTSSANPAVVGSPVTFTATVASAAGPAGTTGNVTFVLKDTHDNVLTFNVAVANGVATLTLANLPVDTYTVTATYAGAAATVEGSSSAPLSQDVDKADSQTVVGVENTITVGTPTTLTATVSNPFGLPLDGTVTFYDGYAAIGTGTIVNGVATLTHTFLTSGPRTLTARYAGSDKLNESEGSLPASVDVAATTTTLSSSANPSVVGDDVTLTAHVSGGYGGVTGGTVIFMEGGVELGRGTVDADGNATLVYPFMTVSESGHQVTAIFQAFGQNAASASNPLNQVVNKAATTTTLTAPATSNAGQSVTFTATVAFPNPLVPATGAVQFWEGSTLLGTVNLSGNQASLTLANLAGGAHTITAVYVGSASHLASTSAPVTHTVNVSNPDVPFQASGRTLRDTTGNGVSSDDTPLPRVSVKIIRDNNGNGILDAGDTLFTTVVSNDAGVFTLTLAPGKYLAQEVTPSGYLQTGPTSGYYAFTASVNDSTTSLDFSNWKQCDCGCDVTKITYIINGTTRVNDLRGNTNPGDVVQAVFTVPAGHTPITVSLVSYTAPSGVWDATLASQQKIWEQQTGTFGPGTYTLTINLPETFYQVDFVCGPVIDQLGPVGSNIFYSAQNRLFSADNDGSIAYVDGTSSISGYVYNDLNNNGVKEANEPGIAGVKVLLTGDNGTSVWATTDARGRYAFANVMPGDYAITETQPAGYFNGKETPGNVFSSVKITAARGSRTGYNFGELAAARLSGFVYVDKNNDGIKQSTEKGLAGVTMSLLNATGQVVATTTTDSTGAYTFANVAAGTYSVVETQPAHYVDGIETAGSLGGYDQGDNNTISSINVASGAVGTNYNFGELPETFVCTGETATIGFWQNKNGQNLIKSFNNSATSKKLAQWLVATFPNLYGPGTTNSLVGKNNNDVAALFTRLFNVSGQKLDAQVLGVALAVYSTTNSLGGTAATRYGFTVDNIGTGNRLYNIGANGAAFGVANYTNMTVLDILDAANDRAVNGVLYNGNTTLRNMANVVFTGINEQGDI